MYSCLRIICTMANSFIKANCFLSIHAKLAPFLLPSNEINYFSTYLESNPVSAVLDFHSSFRLSIKQRNDVMTLLTCYGVREVVICATPRKLSPGCSLDVTQPKTTLNTDLN